MTRPQAVPFPFPSPCWNDGPSLSQIRASNRYFTIVHWLPGAPAGVARAMVVAMVVILCTSDVTGINPRLPTAAFARKPADDAGSAEAFGEGV